MEQHQVSARKFRPSLFGTVLGQSHVTDSLKNSLLKGNIGQAFLFCGPRGVGKTTCARILAKSINCENITPDGEPCENCKSCMAIKNGAIGGIFELDAASNNSVDDARNLIDQVRYLPQNFKKSVYIIDEVHMLSTAAFNALLKTLEEPPKHAVFILATTEKNKILPTIISRCQVFDFKKISVQEIITQLEIVAHSKGYSYDTDALAHIAEKSDGGMRDALSIFDSIANMREDNYISEEATKKHLHILDQETYFEFFEAIQNSDANAVVNKFNEILKSGFDGQNFLSGIGQHCRNLFLIKKDSNASEFLNIRKSIIEKYIEHSQKIEADLLLEFLDIILKCDRDYKSSYNKILIIEIMLIKLATLKKKKLNKGRRIRNSSTNIPPYSPITDTKQSSTTNKIAEQNTSHSESSSKNNDTSSELEKKLTSIKIPSLTSLYKQKTENEIIATEKKLTTEVKELSHSPSQTSTSKEEIAQAISSIANSFAKSGNHLAYTVLNVEKTITESSIVFKISSEIEKSLLQSLEKEIISELVYKFNIHSIKIETEIVQKPPEQVIKNLTLEEIVIELKKDYPAFKLIAEELSLKFM